MRHAILLLVSVLWVNAPAHAAEGAWRPTGPLATIRADATSTLLPSGKVLVVGGSDAEGKILGSAELYDPATGSWAPTGALNTPRTKHTATLLPTRQVLVVGGFNGSAVGTAELYDPAIGTWSPIKGHLADARFQHTATLLPAGKVLVIGGFGLPEVALQSAELFTPATQEWSTIPYPLPLPPARGQHTATLLSSGQVLVAGGSNRGKLVAEAVLYTGTSWLSVGKLSQPRICHTATLLPSGKVLVAGGAASMGSCGSEGSRFTPANAVELYDPSAKQRKWGRAREMQAPRALHTAVLLASGKVLIAGGLLSSTGPKGLRPGGEIYDWKMDLWQPDADLHNFGGNLRQRHTATLLPSGEVLLAGGDQLRSAELYEPFPGFSTRALALPPGGSVTAPTATLLPSGKVLLAGGSRNGAAVKEAWIYDPSTKKWEETCSLGSARVAHTATLLPNGKVLVVGGRSRLDLASPPLSTSELYDPELCDPELCDPELCHSGLCDLQCLETWSPAGQLATARSGHTATLLPSGRILIAGGVGGEPRSALKSSEIYDEVGRWSTTRGGMNGARFEHAAVLLETGKVLVAGGFDKAALGSAELYDPESETWSSTGPLLIPRRQATATFLPGGRVLLAGGSSTTPLADTEVYDPQEGKWAFGIARLQNARTEHEALLLPSGNVLLAGGWDGSGLPLTAVELYDPRLGSFKIGGIKEMRRSPAAVLLPSGNALLVGGTSGSADLNTAEILDLDPKPPMPGPVITRICKEGIDFGRECKIEGNFGSKLEASGSGSNNAAVNYPLVQLLSLEGVQPSWLVPEPQASFDDGTLTVAKLPAALHPGWHRLTVFTSGRAGASQLVKVGCGLAITLQPQKQIVAKHGTATFWVAAEGGQAFQWEKKKEIRCQEGQTEQQDGWCKIDGETDRFYKLPSVDVADTGEYRAVVSGHCSEAISDSAALSISSDKPPTVSVLSPKGGAYWPLSTPNQVNERLITWSMLDELWICKAEVFLSYSGPGRNGELRLKSFGNDRSCSLLDRVTDMSMTYQLPQDPPSGVIGSQYRIRVKVTNSEGLSSEAISNPFNLVQPNPDSVRTLIVHDVGRMKEICQDTKCKGDVDELFIKLQDLADHPRVQGFLVDLGVQDDIEADREKWYNVDPDDKGTSVLANEFLKGIHDILNPLLKKTYTGVKYLVLVGDDRIIPFARIGDRTRLLTEEDYGKGAGLASTTVGGALRDFRILSDDPLASLGPIDSTDPAFTREKDRIVLPDLAVGRLVEEPEEISNTISTFIGRDGVLDLTALDDKTGHKVLVTGYDFLLDSGGVIRDRWKKALKTDPRNHESLGPVDGKLLADWGVDPAKVLGTHLCGNDGDAYAVSFLNGHATHELEGVPGANRFDSQGLSAGALYGSLCNSAPLRLNGGVVFAVGCHGGLPVAGSSDQDHTLDLPQTFLARGAVVYVANTGFGWGLLDGIGYAERLAQILSEEMSAGGVVVTGEAVKRTKLRYFLETPRLDAYDEKSLLQWTFFGLPMYAVRTGIGDRSLNGHQLAFADLSSSRAERPPIERFGSVVVERRSLTTSPESMMQLAAAEPEGGLPHHLTRLHLRFDFSAPGVYTKRGASGADLCPDPDQACDPGCPETEKGCYYTLNGLVDRATGMSDQPIQPYFIYDSRLAGTSQHGVLWKGGTFEEEEDWTPLMAQLVSNTDLESATPLPPHDTPKPRRRKRILGGDPNSCPVSDTEVNSVVVPTGETLDGGSTQRRFTRMHLEVFYFNNSDDPGENCDDSGPTIKPPAPPTQYHDANGDTIFWHIPGENISDDAGEVWRVVVVYNEDNKDNEEGQHQWVALDLTLENGSWQGELVPQHKGRLNYVLQAVDNRGNVSWLDDTPEVSPTSGVVPELPEVVEVNLGLGPG